ncbi:MAG: AAA family ATPase [Deltaproteobacteria bacterium]|nr:AAA family ATPase [Deltaproteobacteria bacterium]
MSTQEGLGEEALRSLALPSAYPDDPSATSGIEALQTHISHVFLTRERVYKIRKPVDLGFLCFATRSHRNADCLNEVRLNRRIAPDVYLGVAAIRRDSAGKWRIGTFRENLEYDLNGEALEHCVVMRRLPANGNAKSLLETGTLQPEHLRGLAKTIARFHAAHGLGRPAPWTVEMWVERTLAPVRDTFELARGATPDAIDQALLGRCEASMMALFSNRRDRFEARRDEGRAVDGHGDLHLDHIWYEHGPGDPIAIDCIEFNDTLRQIDVAAELAFTAMDLGYRARVDLAETLLNAYALETDDYTLYDVIDFHIAHRALVRGSVAGVASGEEELGIEQRRSAALSAAAHLRFAAEGLSSDRRGSIIVVCGIVGTGKSTLANAAAEHLPGVVVASDRVRKRLAGLDPGTRATAAAGDGIYDDASTRRVYRALLERARPIVESGRCAILDATYSRREQREAVMRWANERGLDAFLLEARCEASETRRRLFEREQDPERISDAGVDFHAESTRRFEPTDEWPAERRALIRTDLPNWQATLRNLLERIYGS